LFQALARTGEFLDDAFDARGPDEGLGGGVPRGKEGIDGLLEFRDAAEGAAANGLACEFAKPALDQIEPAGAGGNEVQDEAGMLLEPALHEGVFVRAIVVEDEVEEQAGRELGIETLEELEEFLVAVARIALADDAPLHHQQRGEHSRG